VLKEGAVARFWTVSYSSYVCSKQKSKALQFVIVVRLIARTITVSSDLFRNLQLRIPFCLLHPAPPIFLLRH